MLYSIVMLTYGAMTDDPLLQKAMSGSQGCGGSYTTEQIPMNTREWTCLASIVFAGITIIATSEQLVFEVECTKDPTDRVWEAKIKEVFKTWRFKLTSRRLCQAPEDRFPYFTDGCDLDPGPSSIHRPARFVVEGPLKFSWNFDKHYLTGILFQL